MHAVWDAGVVAARGRSGGGQQGLSFVSACVHRRRGTALRCCSRLVRPCTRARSSAPPHAARTLLRPGASLLHSACTAAALPHCCQHTHPCAPAAPAPGRAICGSTCLLQTRAPSTCTSSMALTGQAISPACTTAGRRGSCCSRTRWAAVQAQGPGVGVGVGGTC
jgi:hypothetical protein